MNLSEPPAKHFSNLVQKLCLDTISDPERDELNTWIQRNEGNRAAINEMIKLCSPHYCEQLDKRKNDNLQKVLAKISGFNNP